MIKKTIEEVVEWMDGQLQIGELFIKDFAPEPGDLHAVLMKASIIGRQSTLDQLKAYINGEEGEV